MTSPAEIRKHIKSGKTGPLYLLEGDDLQSRHDLALEFAAVVEEGLQAFNVESFYANEATNVTARDAMLGSLLSTARTLPMMAPRRVILLHEAERLLSPKRGAKEDDDGQLALEPGVKKKRPITPLEELEAYFERPEPMTTLVFVAGPLDGGRRLVKLLRKKAVHVNCGTLADAQEAAQWIQKRLEKDELTIDPKALQLLLSATGLRLGRIRAEVEKLVLFVTGEPTITTTHVRDLVITQNDVGVQFALMDAIRDGQPAKALKEISALVDAGMQPPMILGQIRAATIKLRPDARVKNGLELVFRADQAIKSSSGAPQYLLECLVVELCAR
ncbi:MAG: DNA polymerase III subunit delta [Vicinamibacterales bacterium]